VCSGTLQLMGMKHRVGMIIRAFIGFAKPCGFEICVACPGLPEDQDMQPLFWGEGRKQLHVLVFRRTRTCRPIQNQDMHYPTGQWVLHVLILDLSRWVGRSLSEGSIVSNCASSHTLTSTSPTLLSVHTCCGSCSGSKASKIQAGI
jgi:hypothetical protein